MSLLTPALHDLLHGHHLARLEALDKGERSPDPVPVGRLFNPVGHATWLATEIDSQGVLFGLADLGFGSPELASFSLKEIEAVRLPFGMPIERDPRFHAAYPLSVYAQAARRAGSIVLAERLLEEATMTLQGKR